jgi:type VI secretion system protein ImpK
MESNLSASTFVINFFQDFYREVLVQREIALKSLERSDITKELASEEPVPQDQEYESEAHGEPYQNEHQVENEMLTDKIQQKFIGMFEEFSLNTQHQAGEFAVTHFQEALYGMVALLDEVFLSFTWGGQRRWENNLMEKRFFHTQVAGELIFRKIEDLIQANDATRWDLAAIYLMILALGFKGKYRGEDDAGRLNWYRQQLYILINKHPSSLFHPGRSHLINECYDHTLSIPIIKGLPDVKNWFFACLGMIVVYLIVTSFLWYNLVRDMDETLGHIVTQSHKLRVS